MSGTAQPRPLAWPIILTIAVVPLAAHLLCAGRYGIFRDEYYYLACARHLAWGYVDHPPLSIALLSLLRAYFGEGLWTLRVPPALCASATVVLTAALAARFGGDRFAQALAALSMAIVGVMLAITGYYSMNALDLVFWTAAWLLLAHWAARFSGGALIALGALLGIGLLNKLGLLVLGAALFPATLMTPLRRSLRTSAPYIGALLALLIVTPNLLWQSQHGWPTLEFIKNAQAHKITALSPLKFVAEVALEQHPANLLVWTVGLAWLLVAPRARPFRVLGLTALIAFGILLATRAKPYYAAGLFPPLLAAGACFWAQLNRERPWLSWGWVALLAGSGLFLLPATVPVLPAATFARWQSWLGLAPAAQEVGHEKAKLPQHYADRFGWGELSAEVTRVTNGLSKRERDQLVIVTDNYGLAASLEYDGVGPVVSGHNNYFLWAPQELALGTVILVGFSEARVREAFEHVERAGTVRSEWALIDGTPIWLARQPKLTWPELRQRLRRFM